MLKEWNFLFIILLYKNGDFNNKNNYRGFSVVSC